MLALVRAIERNQKGQTAHPVLPVPEQEIQEDGYKQARDQNSRHAANRRACVIQQIAAHRLHAVEEFRPNRFFINREAGRQCINDPVGSVGHESRPAPFLKRTPIKGIVSGPQLLGENHSCKCNDETQCEDGGEGDEEAPSIPAAGLDG